MTKKVLNDAIRLGLLSPLTGIVGIYGPEIVWAARIACDEINEQGGVLGRPLELIVEDDGSLPQTAIPAALKLIDDYQCTAIIGNLLSNARIAVLNHVAEPRKIPLLNFSFYEGSLYSRYFFHFAALPNQQIEKMIPYMAQHFGQKMFFAGNNYEWPRGSIDAAKHVLRQIGGDIVGEEYLEIGIKKNDVDALLKQVARSGADVFVPYFAGSDQIMLLTHFTELGLKNHMAVVMGHYDEMMASKLPAVVRAGFYSSNTYFMSADTVENKRYLERLKQQPDVAGIWPKGNGILTNFGEGTYQCVHAFAKALQTAGKLDVESLVNVLETISVTGPQGKIHMQAKTHHATVNNYLSRCNADGTFSIIKHFEGIRPVIPPRYKHHVKFDLSQEPKWINEKNSSTVIGVEQLLSLVDTAILMVDETGAIMVANRNACQLFGYKLEELNGMSIRLLFPPNFRERYAKTFKQFIRSNEMNHRMNTHGTVMGYRKDGAFISLDTGIAKFHNKNEWVLVFTMQDITVQKRTEEKLIWQSTHDKLTGLPNRSLIYDRLSNALLRSQRKKVYIAVLFLDLDNFKLINDTYGHEAGDILLKIVSERLLEEVRPGDTVGRLAGDEFIVICEQIEETNSISKLAMRIKDALRQPIEFNQSKMFVSASIGVAVSYDHQCSAEDLLRSSDSAMYAAKQKGRDNFQFFNEKLQSETDKKLAIIKGLRFALAHNELLAYFQPIVTADDGHITGVEVLLRWYTAEDWISPATFIPIAEMVGIIMPIGYWVFREGCRAVTSWRSYFGDKAPYVSINVSARQLNDKQLANEFANILRETGADPRYILLEITESSLMSDIETNLDVLQQLADLGLQIAVDDFGTGYSSLSHLSRLPVSVLKIDKSFIDDMETKHEKYTLVHSIIVLGHSLGLKIVAEGVENEMQLAELKKLNCDLVQGYLFFKPMDEQTLIKEMHSIL